MPFMILEQEKGDHLFPSGIHQGTEGLPKTRRLKCIMSHKKHKTKQNKNNNTKTKNLKLLKKSKEKKEHVSSSLASKLTMSTRAGLRHHEVLRI